jgi:hypothetical protein
MNKLITALAFVGLLSAPQLVGASTFYSPNSAAATNTNASGTVADLINGDGMPVTPVTLYNIGTIAHSSAVDGELWRGDWSHTDPTPIKLTFDFSMPQQISYVGLWQGFGDREGTGAFELRFWDGANGTGTEIGAVFSNQLDPDVTYDGMSLYSDQISLFGRAFNVGLRNGVTSFTLDINDNAVHFSPFVHLGEVMVAVPEPSTYASLMALGLGGLYIRRRQCRKKS